MSNNQYGGKPRIRVTSDGLMNVMTGMGTDRDRRMFNRFQFGMMQDFGELERGIGKTSVRLDSQTRPKRLTINLIPGCDQVRQILAVAKTGVDASFTFFQTGTAETVMGFDGVLVNRGSMGRGGKTSVSDEQFIFEFADSEET